MQDRLNRWLKRVGTLERPDRRALLGAVAVLVVLLTLWTQVVAWYRARLIADERTRVTADLVHDGNAIAAAVNRRGMVLEGLAADVLSHMNDDAMIPGVELAADWLIERVYDISYVTLAPNGVQTYVFPRGVYTNLLGVDLLAEQRPDVKSDVDRAIELRAVTLNNLDSPAAGAPDTVAYYALFYQDKLWGLLTLGFDLNTIWSEANLGFSSPDIDVSLRNEWGRNLFGGDDVYAKEPVIYHLQGVNDDWVLAAAPKTGWDSLIQGALVPFQLAGLAIVGLIVVLAYLAIDQRQRLVVAVQQRTEVLRRLQMELEDRVRERTAELMYANEELQQEIIERQRVEHRLRESEELYRTLITASPDAVTVTDAQGRISFASDKVLEIFGYDLAHGVIGWPLLNGVEPADRPRAEAALARLLSAGEPVDSTQLTMRRKDGSTFIGEVDSARLIDAAGQATGVVSIIRDITRRVEMQSELARSEARFRSLIEDAPVGIRLGRNGRTLYANSACVRLFGFVTAAEMIGHPLTEQIAVEARAEVQQYIDQRERGDHSPTEYETIGLRHDGTCFPVHIAVARLELPDGPANISFFTDITERKQAEEALRQAHDELEQRVQDRTVELRLTNASLLAEIDGRQRAQEALRLSEQRNRSIIENSADGITLVDERGVIIEWNQGQTQMTGLARSAAVGQFIWDVQLQLAAPAKRTPERLAQIKAYTLHALQTGRFPGEANPAQERSVVQPGGETRVIQPAPSLIKTDQGYMIVSVTRDVTERRTSEEALRQSEVRFRTVANFTYDWEYWLGPDQQIIYISPSCERVTGYTAAEFITRPELLDEIVHPDDRGIVRDHTHLSLAGGELTPIDYRIRRRDGQERWIGHLCRPVFDETGHALGRRISNRDITERKQAEDAVREQEKLYRGIFETTADGLVIADMDGVVLEVNPAFCDMHGYGCGESAGRRVTSFLHPAHRHLFAESVAAVRANRTFQAQAVNLRKDDRPFHVEVRAIGLTYYGALHMLYVFRDVSAQVEAYVRLEQRVRERTHELSMLLEFSHSMTRTLEMQPLLRLILNQLRSVVDYTGAAILSLDDGQMEFVAYQGPRGEREVQPLRLVIDSPLAQAVLNRARPVIIPDVTADTPLAQAFRDSLGDRAVSMFGHIRSWMGIPMILSERIVGLLGISQVQAGHFTQRHAELAIAFANQAVMAIENARLYEQAKDLAAIQERQRLARELHDSVSQTLFSASLAAQVLPRLWSRHPDEGEQCLNELSRLTRGALAEMRTLLVELRPNVLVESNLGDLLRQLAEAITSRTRVPVQIVTEGQVTLPPDVQVALYRIAQEALNNVAKHASASQAVVELHHQALDNGASTGVELRVTDDGRGFNQVGITADHLGLGIMRERAESIAADICIDSQIGHGTRVTVIWPKIQASEPT